MQNKKKNIAFYERGSWYHRTKIIQNDGTVKYGKKGGFKTAEEAERSYKKYNEKFMEKAKIKSKLNLDISLSEYLLYWFEEVYRHKVQSSTQALGIYVMYQLILPSITDERKLKMTTTEYINCLLGKIEEISYTGANKSREMLNQALQASVGIYINENPVTKSNKYPRKKNSITILNKEELSKLLEVASCENWYLEILLGVFCGLTKGEILGLKFNDFDIEKGTISIERKLVMDSKIEKDDVDNKLKVVKYNEIEKSLDNINAYRRFKVPNIIIEELIKRKKFVGCWKSINKNYMDNNYVSCRTNGLPHSLTSFNAYLKKICIKNSLPAISVNGLRHIFAIILLEHGISLVKISALLGHSSINTTFEYLYDVISENKEITTFINHNFVWR